MKAERLAEWRKFAIETIPQIARLSDESESERVIISTCATAILELIDALTAERARAEKAEGELDRLRLVMAIRWADAEKTGDLG